MNRRHSARGARGDSGSARIYLGHRKVNRSRSDLGWKPSGTRKCLRGGTAAFLYMDDADHGGQPDLKSGGALARAQRIDTVVIRLRLRPQRPLRSESSVPPDSALASLGAVNRLEQSLVAKPSEARARFEIGADAETRLGSVTSGYRQGR